MDKLSRKQAWWREHPLRPYEGFYEVVPLVLERDGHTCQCCGDNAARRLEKKAERLKAADRHRRWVLDDFDIYEWTCYRCGRLATFVQPGYGYYDDHCEHCGAWFGPDYEIEWMEEHEPARVDKRWIQLPSEYESIERAPVGLDLMVHHIDGNKRNQATSNLITLCRSCHAKVEGAWRKAAKS